MNEEFLEIEKAFREFYKQYRNNYYYPNELKCIFLLESPPISGKYFFKTDGKPSEPLYLAMMRCILRKEQIPQKEIGLEEFAHQGYLLVDACYIPINKVRDNLANKIIRTVTANLVKDLDEIFNTINNQEIEIILVKSNICNIFGNDDEFVHKYNVVNHNHNIPFPSNGQQKRFCEEVNNLLRRDICPYHLVN